MPKVKWPVQDGWTWNSVARSGDIVGELANMASELPADLVVMATQGHKGFLDALRGSTTERVLHGARCPLLAVPMVQTAVETVPLGFNPVSPRIVPV